MSAEKTQYVVRLSYDTCGDSPEDAIETALAAIESRSSAFVRVYEDGINDSIREGELHEFPAPPKPPSKVQLVAKEYLYCLDADEADVIMNVTGNWSALQDKMHHLGAYDLDQYDDRIIFALGRDHWDKEQAIVDTIAEELDRMTGRAVTEQLEQLAGFGSF